MKTRKLATIIAGTPGTATLLPAQHYSVDWWEVAGGGTIADGPYSLTGGFWVLPTPVQTSGAPLLSILRTTANPVPVIWPSRSTGWKLQQNTNSISSVNWSSVTSGIQDDGTTTSLIVNPPTGSRFYRLTKP